MDISSVSDNEYIQIVGHYNKLQNKDRVDPRLLSRGFTEDQIRQMQEHVDKRGTSDVTSLNVTFTCDLNKFHYDNFGFVAELASQYHKSGVLPFNGNLADQPAKIIELFQIFEQLKYETQQRLRDQAEREQRRKQRKVNGRR